MPQTMITTKHLEGSKDNPDQPIRVLVVDDSDFMRRSLTHLLQSDPGIDVIGTANNGEQAVAEVQRLRPDVVLLDVQMPVMDGLQALGQIMAQCPTPILMLSGVVEQDGQLSMRSLYHGAVDFIAKPSGVISYDIDQIKAEILHKVKIAASANVHSKVQSVVDRSYRLPAHAPVSVAKNLIILGASTGGPSAIRQILSALPDDFPAAIMVVQHMSDTFIPYFVDSLQAHCRMPVAMIYEGTIIRAGHVLVASGGFHYSIVRDRAGVVIHLTRSRTKRRSLSINEVMADLAGVYRASVLGVLLTGVGEDGAQGMLRIKLAGGTTIAEEASTCMVYGMPRAAIEAGVVDKVLPLPQIASEIIRQTRALSPTGKS
jgi:two-component system chemotaxis response regulator CheB